VECDYVQQRTAHRHDYASAGRRTHRADALLPPWHRACFLPIAGSSCAAPGESR